MKNSEFRFYTVLIAGLFALCFALVGSSFAQDYKIEVSEVEFSLDAKSYKGYTTDFNMDYSSIKKEWWRYIKKMAVIENHKTFYIIKFPSDNANSTEAVKIISILEGDEHSCTLKTSLYDQKLNKKFLSFSKNILIDFKLSLFTKNVQKKIDASEKSAVKISRNIDTNSKLISSYTYKKQRGKGNLRELTRNIRKLEVVQDSLKIQLIYVQNEVVDNRQLLKKIN